MNRCEVFRRCALIVPAVVLVVSGCASPNVNPSKPRTSTGYVDFYSDFAGELAWGVQRFDTKAGRFKSVYSDVRPIEGRVLRLAFAPGPTRLQVTFLNRVIASPAELDVNVQAEQITPVHVSLSGSGTTQVQTKEQSRGGTAWGTFGRRVRVGSDESVMYDLAATADSPVPYQLKEQMPYAR